MSISSPDASPNSVLSGGRLFSISKDQFGFDLPSPRLHILTNGHGNINGAGNLNSPSLLKSPSTRRLQQFSREGILGSAQKARTLSQTSVDRESMTNGTQNQNTIQSQNQNHNQNQSQNQNQNQQTNEDAINPLKRRSTDAGIDYPRRRATIAVSQ